MEAEKFSEVAADLEKVVELVEELKSRKMAVKAHEEFLDTAKSAYAECEREVMAVLDAAGLDKFVGAGCSVALRTKSSWRTPKDPVAREEFFNYLREQKVFDSLITVHSQTLNAWANAEQEVAQAKGQFDFRVPGLEEPTEYKVLSLKMKG